MRIGDWSSDVCSSDLYSGCSYSPSYGGWSTCVSGTQSRSVTCTRSDGVQVAASYCGTTPTQSQTCSTPTCMAAPRFRFRSEEHTSELQSLMRISYAVFCLKKKKTNNKI